MRFFFILFLFLTLSFTLKCQSFAGLKSGFDGYHFNAPEAGHSVEHFNYLGSSPVIGIFWRERSGNLVQLAGELTYIYRSFSVNATWGGLGGASDLKASYFLNNLVFRFEPQFVFGKELKFYVYPGFYINYTVKANIYGEESSWLSGTSGRYEKFEGDGNYSNWYGGICAGTGMEYNIGDKLLIFVDFTYEMNISDIGGIWNNPKLKMFDYNLSAGLGYKFGSFSFKKVIRKIESSNSNSQK